MTAARSDARQRSAPGECPICAEPRPPERCCGAVLTGPEVFDLVECPRCAVRRLSPQPTDAQLAAFYRPHYFGSDWYRQRGKGLAFARYELRGLPPGRFLDVGCGLGYFLDGVRTASGWQVAGVEFSPDAAAHARRHLRLDVREGELADARFASEAFDFVHVNNVLEHVRHPVAFLRECRRLLAAGGVFSLSVPNGRVDSQALMAFEQRHRRPGRSKDGHLFFFARDALLGMLEQAGFRPERLYTSSIRRGLRILGRYPSWKPRDRVYDWQPVAGDTPEQGASRSPHGPARVVLAPEKRRPRLYYHYRYLQARLKRLRGLREFGLDFLIYAR